MSTDESDAPILAGLAPRAVADWLRMRGFKHTGTFGQHGALFARESESGRSELLLPTSPQVRDFVRRMAELVDDLAEAERRMSSDVLTDLSLAPFDVIKVRSPDADKYGSVRLSTGIDLHEEARNIVLAAASAAASPVPRKSWRGRRPEEVDAYLENVRLGQTQRGSFVLTMLSPWDFSPGSTLPLDLGEPNFGRRVTRSLARALTATKNALLRSVTEGVSPMVEAYREGVSANLYNALAKIAREGDGVDLSLDWSPTQPEPEAIKISLNREDAVILSEAARVLASEEPEPGATLIGSVAVIAEAPERFNGEATLVTLIDGKPRKVRVMFGANDREKIYDAAKEKLWVRVVGDLQREKQRLVLLSPRDITIVAPDEG